MLKKKKKFKSDTLSIRYHEFRTSGPHLRSQEMKMPCNIGQKKQKNIDIVIDKLKLGFFLIKKLIN